MTSPSTPPPDDGLYCNPNYLPDAYRELYKRIDHRDLYLIAECGTTPVRIRRVPYDTKAHTLHEIEHEFATSEALKMRRVSGRDLRSLLLCLGRAHNDLANGF